MGKSKSSEKNRVPRTSAKTTRPGSPLQRSSPPPTVSGRWLISAFAIAIAAALLCAWGTLCALFWQGSWQLLYHPVSTVTRTPASVNLQFESIGFGANASGEPQLRGWWIPATTGRRYTALFLHAADGNLGDTVEALARLHSLGLNVFAFDYRGYGESHFAHPSEARWREDADSAIRYLTGTRHIPAGSLVLIGKDLGANLALETGSVHPDLAGVVLENPFESPTTAIFRDARSRLVPARFLVSDRWDSNDAAANLLIPSLWFYWTVKDRGNEDTPEAYQKSPARKMLVWLTNSADEPKQFTAAMTSWLDQLPAGH